MVFYSASQQFFLGWDKFLRVLGSQWLARARGASNMNPLSFLGVCGSEVVPAAQRFLRFAAQPRRVKGSMRWAARMKATMMTTPMPNSTAWTMWAHVSWGKRQQQRLRR
jgi:hypothetical protein